MYKLYNTISIPSIIRYFPFINYLNHCPIPKNKIIVPFPCSPSL